MRRNHTCPWGEQKCFQTLPQLQHISLLSSPKSFLFWLRLQFLHHFLHTQWPEQLQYLLQIIKTYCNCNTLFLVLPELAPVIQTTFPLSSSLTFLPYFSYRRVVRSASKKILTMITQMTANPRPAPINKIIFERHFSLDVLTFFFNFQTTHLLSSFLPALPCLATNSI